jgi:hypothetical protein
LHQTKKAAENEINLSKQIGEIEDKIKRDPNNYIENIERLEVLNNDLEDLRKQKINGMIIRSRAKWSELGEKSSKYLCNLVNLNFTNKNIQELKNDNGSTIVD